MRSGIFTIIEDCREKPKEEVGETGRAFKGFINVSFMRMAEVDLRE